MVGRQYSDERKIEIINKFEEYIQTEPRPFVSSFCARNDIFIPRQRLYDWGKESEKLGLLLEICKTKQRSSLCEGGLDNEYNSVITRLILSTNHKFTERTENTGDADKPEQKVITLQMNPKDAARVYAEMIKGDE